MAINGSDLINEPWNTTFSPFTDLFEAMIGNGMVFFLFPLSVVTIALFVKTRNTAMTSMFMIVSGLLFATGNLFLNVPTMGIIFLIFAAIGFTGLFVSLFINER